MILRCRDLLPFIWSGCNNKWLVVVLLYDTSYRMFISFECQIRPFYIFVQFCILRQCYMAFLKRDIVVFCRVDMIE